MRPLLYLAILPLVTLCASQRLRYPEARRSDHVDVYHGIRVPDPYRWLEESNAPETERWVEEQHKLSRSWLDAIPERTAIRDRLRELYNYERYSGVFKAGRFYFYRYNSGLQNQSVLYMSPALNARGRILLDPNTWSPDGTVSLGNIATTHDGRFLAYSISRAGSDWQEHRFIETATGRLLPDVLDKIKFSGMAWLKDGSGYFYSAYDPTHSKKKKEDINIGHRLYFHKLGTSQQEDQLVFQRSDPKELVVAEVTDDGRFLIITVMNDASAKRNAIYYQDLSQRGSLVRPLFPNYDARYEFIGSRGDWLYFITTHGAPRSRVIAAPITQPTPPQWRVIIPEAQEALETVRWVGGRLFAQYLKDAHSEVRIFDEQGRAKGVLPLPGLGYVSSFSGRQSDTEAFFSFTSFTVPATVYRYDVKSGRAEVYRKPAFRADLSQFETRQVFYTSKDGTRVPMFITHKKGLALNGRNPTILYGYGGFNAPVTPSFNPVYVVWMERGGVYAVANLRGGGEYGDEWYQAGTKERKQNVFDDFISAAEWLIANRYTSAKKLAIRGRSNGGLLVGAVLNQRPDLFGAAVPQVGVMDMLRFHKFTIGWAWVGDYGSPDNPEEFKALYAYSPLHNIKPGTHYPAVLITTADHDDRVVPAHSYKYAAALQAAQAGDAPILLRIQRQAGHGAGTPLSALIEEEADVLAFLTAALKD
jgi:prolyl oligopeptidase